eukprot:sb/3475841/
MATVLLTLKGAKRTTRRSRVGYQEADPMGALLLFTVLELPVEVFGYFLMTFNIKAKAKQATWINPIVGVLISLSMAFQPPSFLCSIAGRHPTATTIRLCSSVCTRVTFRSLKRAPTNHSLVD